MINQSINQDQSNKMSRGIRRFILQVFVVITLFPALRADVDERLIEIDLYKVLGVPKNASLKEIKKAYRKLAQIHHPDKHIGKNGKKSNHQNDKEMNEAIFREIAEAHEILSNPSNREEYDYKRKMFVEGNDRRTYKDGDFNYRREYSRSQFEGHEDAQFRNMYESMEQPSSGFESFFSQSPPSFDIPQPILVGSILPAGRVLLPFSPIITSPELSYFTYLDHLCSLVVVKGNAQVFIQYLMHNSYSSPPDVDELYNTFPPNDNNDYENHDKMRVVFRSDPYPQLQMNCFAGLMEEGVLAVFAGHPEAPGHRPVWVTDNSNFYEQNPHNMYFRRVYLELCEHGELVVRALSAGRAQAVCMWSSWSGSCSPMERQLNRAKETLRGSVKPILKGWFTLRRTYHKEFLPSIQSYYKKLLSGELASALMDKFRHMLKLVLASEEFRRLSVYFKEVSNYLLGAVRHIWKKLGLDKWLFSSLCAVDGFGRSLLKNPVGDGWLEWVRGALMAGERAKRACLDHVDAEKGEEDKVYNYYDDMPKKVKRKRRRKRPVEA